MPGETPGGRRLFRVEGDASDGEVLLEGDCARVKCVGAEMKTGRLTIQGNVGMHLGAEMRGGEIRVHGNAGDWVGAEMRGGRIHVHGDAGHLVGAGYRGSRLGMRGGDCDCHNAMSPHAPMMEPALGGPALMPGGPPSTLPTITSIPTTPPPQAFKVPTATTTPYNPSN